ncbi:hypothetical protein BVRB_9g217560 [Beta vulgaris subsp. vulgaris]|nr:hypothetical protein BVRB_9g217560 [Beta vulgaris subsp. vulgaris]
MIYRKWSLLSSTMLITGGIVTTIALGNLVFYRKDPFPTAELKKRNESLLK